MRREEKERRFDLIHRHIQRQLPVTIRINRPDMDRAYGVGHPLFPRLDLFAVVVGGGDEVPDRFGGVGVVDRDRLHHIKGVEPPITVVVVYPRILVGVVHAGALRVFFRIICEHIHRAERQHERENRNDKHDLLQHEILSL